MTTRAALGAIALSAGALLSVALECRAQSGWPHGHGAGPVQTHTIGAHNIEVRFNALWPAGSGPYPLDVVIEAQTAAPQDRTLRLEITSDTYHLRHNYGHRAFSGHSVAYIDLPGGKTEAQGRLTLFNEWGSAEFAVEGYWDGEPNPSLFAAFYFEPSSEPGVLDVRSTTPSRVALPPNPQSYPSPTGLAIDPTELPAQWILLAGVDFIAIDLEELLRIEQADDGRWEALRQWVAAGGRLILRGVRSDEDRADVAALFGQAANWLKASNTAALGYGRVFAGVSFRSARAEWSRAGTRADRSIGSVPYDLLRIEGLGEPPITAFLLLITGFAILIGPVNFILLSRMGRLYLALATVPTSAALVVVALFVFAAMQDGFATRSRQLSVTRIEPKAGLAVTTNAQCYFPAIVSGSSLIYDGQTVAYVAERPDTLPLEYQASPDQQILGGGALASRQWTDMLTVNVEESAARLVVRKLPGGGWEVENRLGVDVEKLVVWPETTQGFGCRGLAAGAKRKLGAAPTLAFDLHPFNSHFVSILRSRQRPRFEADDWIRDLGDSSSRPGEFIALVPAPADDANGLAGVVPEASWRLITGPVLFGDQP